MPNIDKKARIFFVVYSNAAKTLVVRAVKKKLTSYKELHILKNKISREFSVPSIPNIELIKIYRKMLKKKEIKNNRKFEFLIRKRRIRTISGVAPVAVLTKFFPCPGKCAYCPTESSMPKSYLSNEPAVMRAILAGFDPYIQVSRRLKALRDNGHDISKIELIVIGGTWSALPKQYQTWFLKKCYMALNNSKSKNVRLEKLKKDNEKASHRCVGLTLETRPDFITRKEIERMRKFGCTRVELGVQSIYDDVLDLNKRGHTAEKTVEATKLLKDAGMKVCYHIMPGLPGSSVRKDLKMFKIIFTDQRFQPDFIKIYPCVVTKGAVIYKWHKEGKYRPYSDYQLVSLIKKMKKLVPPYVRILRLIRDIPATSIAGGTKISNLRQKVQAQMKEEGIKCRCVRCREVKNEKHKIQNLKMVRREYDGSGGKEIFLSFEDEKKDKLVSLLRLRVNGGRLMKEIEDCALVREVHTYGEVENVNDKKNGIKNKKNFQHKGFGKKLIKEAEKIAKKEFSYKRIAVISGVGARKYYKKLKYKLKGEYMLKNL